MMPKTQRFCKINLKTSVLCSALGEIAAAINNLEALQVAVSDVERLQVGGAWALTLFFLLFPLIKTSLEHYQLKLGYHESSGFRKTLRERTNTLIF